MSDLLPYQRPFPRGSMFTRISRYPDLHFAERARQEHYYRSKNPEGYRHDLGAQDVFIDNLGIMFAEQFASRPQELEYFLEVQDWLRKYEWAWRQVLPTKPWWGKYINSSTRTGAAGEPRPILRLLQSLRAHFDSQSIDQLSPDRWLYPNWAEDWQGRFFREGYDQAPYRGEIPQMGVPLPLEFQRPVPEVRLLPVEACTPDLPMRVGFDTEDTQRAIVDLSARNQGLLPTCASFALTNAIQLAFLRAGRTVPDLSVACLHLLSGDELHAGRKLSDLVELLRSRRSEALSELDLPYRLVEQGHVRSKSDLAVTEGDATLRLRGELEGVEFYPIEPAALVGDVPLLKTLLAAGWVVYLATRITSGFRERRVASNWGVPLVPLTGERPIGGHAWCLFGYDTVDGGTHHWRYQGRFTAINSWGHGAHVHSPFGRGTCTLPFTFVLQEGFEAYALRVRS